MRLSVSVVWLLVAAAALAGRGGAERAGEASPPTRLKQNPLITVASSPTLGGNVNGPTVIRVPTWIQHPLGRYYMYFANHMGDFIRLAYADDVAGPWKIYEPGVLHVRDTAFYRQLPDPPAAIDDFYTHVASPEIVIDATNQRLVMWFHGWWTNGERWPADLAAARAWARQKQYGQFTQTAVSSDGLHFSVQPSITRQSYLRTFQFGAYYYSVARLGTLGRSKDPLTAFENGPGLFRDTSYANRVRHVALAQDGDRLSVFFTAIGDAPERVMVSTVDLRGDWTTWRASPPREVLRPETSYECADLADAPSEAGDVETPVKQVRDPFIFRENGRSWLFYSICGEQGIAAAVIQ
jgi:hypothetical protein